MGINCEKNEKTRIGLLPRFVKRKVPAIFVGLAKARSDAYTHFAPTARDVTRLFAIVAITVLTNFGIYAQANMDYAVHANIVYRFTKYVDWPEERKEGDFVIGIVGDSPLYSQLKNFITNKSVGQQKIVIKKFTASEVAYHCHILFIAENKSGSVKKIAATTKGTSVLLVSESDGLARKGSCINFVLIDDHLKLEINKNNIEERDLSIATELLSLGILVK